MECLASPIAREKGILEASTDLREYTCLKATHDVIGHYNWFDIFDLRIVRSPQESVMISGERGDIDQSEAGGSLDVLVEEVGIAAENGDEQLCALLEQLVR